MPKTNPDSQLALAALQLASTTPWEKITLEQIARKAKVPAAQIEKRFAAPQNLLPVIVEHVSEEAFRAAGKPDFKADPRDSLFENLMARFDVLQGNRKAILSVAKAVKCDPRVGPILVPAQIDAMKKTLANAGIKLKNTHLAAASVGLWLVFLVAFRIWEKDETLDMSRTMAALDKALRATSRIATLLRFD